MIKTDCFAYYDDPQRCSALKDLYCRYEECRFYKPRTERTAPTPTVVKNSKLTWQEVAFIRNHYIPRDLNYGIVGLSKKFNVSPKAIQAIVLGVTWKEEASPGDV